MLYGMKVILAGTRALFKIVASTFEQQYVMLCKARVQEVSMNTVDAA
jgi:hypothetical protein